MTAGFPDRAGFRANLAAVAAAADVVEIGVPFSDPMADGVTIQRSSRAALQDGVTLPWLLEELDAIRPRPRAPVLLMSYLNPLLAYGLARLPRIRRGARASRDSSSRTCRTRKARTCARRSTGRAWHWCRW